MAPTIPINTTVQPIPIPAAAPVLRPEDEDVYVGVEVEVGDGIDNAVEVGVLGDSVEIFGTLGFWLNLHSYDIS